MCRATVAPAAYGHYLHKTPDLARVYHAYVAIRATPGRDLSACRGPDIEPLDHHHPKILLPSAIFFLTVINVLLYSKYPMALDHYASTLVERLLRRFVMRQSMKVGVVL